jgi:hypothetical protein
MEYEEIGTFVCIRKEQSTTQTGPTAQVSDSIISWVKVSDRQPVSDMPIFHPTLFLERECKINVFTMQK